MATWLLAIDSLELDSINLHERPLLTDRSDRLGFATRRRDGITGSQFVRVVPDVARWVILFKCDDEDARDAILAALGGDVTEERRLLAEREDIASSHVVAYAIPVKIVEPNSLDLLVEFEGMDSVWVSEDAATASKSFASSLDRALHLDVPGNTRTAPRVILTPTAQRTGSAGANAGWKFRRRCTITNNSDVPWYRYPCRISMGSTTAGVAAGKSQADGDDVRLWLDGMEIARTVVTWNTANSFIWFIIPALLAGASMVVDVVYGNSAAVSPPDLVYPDRPPFFMSTGSNAIWPYPQDEDVIGNDGLGIWHLSSGVEPITPDYGTPGSWRPVRTMANPDNTDIGHQSVYDGDGGPISALARFHAERDKEPPSDAAFGEHNEYDGVALYNPLPIVKLRAGFSYNNNDAAWDIGILCRNTSGEEWHRFVDDLANDTSGNTTDIAPADYTLPTPSRHLAVVVQPENQWDANVEYGNDISARGHEEWTVTLDDSDMDITLAAEEEIYELATELRLGGGDALVPPYRSLLIGNARGESGPGTPRAAVTLTQALIVDADAHTHEIWDADLTGRIASLPAHAVSGVVGRDSNGETEEHPASEWLPLAPTRTRVPNGSFDADIGGWMGQPVDGSGWSLQGTFGTLGSGNGNFDTPAQVAVDSSGNVYIADTANNRLKKHNSAGAFVSQITGLTGITGVAVDASGNIYVAYGNLLRKYNSALVLQWTSSAFTGGAFKHVGTDGTNLWVADDNTTFGPQISKHLCSTGAQVAIIDYGTGSGNGQFNDPYGIAVDSTHVYASDLANHRIQKFTKAGAFVTKWGTFGTGNGQFNAPRGIGLDDSGRLWVADYGNDRLQRFSNAGTWQQSIAQANPDGVDLATGDVLWVSNADSDNIAKWDEAVASAIYSWDGAVGGEGLGALHIDATDFTDGVEAEAVNATWFPVNGRESVEVAAWSTTGHALLVPLLRILWADDDETVLRTDTEALWTVVAFDPTHRRVFAARAPGRATKYRVALVAHATGSSSSSVRWDDVTLNDNELIVSDANLTGGGDLDVQVELQGRWL